jgi:hypothetical protein
MGGVEGCKPALFGTPEGENPLGRPRRRCTYNIKVLLKKIWRKGVN